MNRRKFIQNTSLLGLSTPFLSSFSSPTQEIIKPRALPKNGTVQLITPASALTRTAFENTLENIDALGFQAKYSDNIRVRSGFLSGTDEQRKDDLMNAFKDDSVDGIICARGGYGTGRLLPLIDFDTIRENAKVFVGFSDITALHLAFYQMAGLVSFHGPVGASAVNDFNTDYLFDILSKGKKVKIENDESSPIRSGLATGPMIGGNLSLLTSLMGTPFDISYDDHILFIEEVGESTYRVDRMLTQLLNAGKLDRIRGIALGYFTNCDTKEDDPFFDYSTSLDEVFKDRFKDLDIPIAKGFPIGHESHNATVPIGIPAELDADKGQIKFLESAVL
ncbi:MAG: LD-carboxypeptidase [Cyclobacteriaceae bacterium]